MFEIEIIEIFALIGLLFLSAFFSGSETALIASRRVKLEAESDKGSKSARKALELLDDPGSLLSTILVGNNMVNVAAAALVTSMIGPVYATIFVTVLLLVFGEIPPKTIAATWPERITRLIAFPIATIHKMLAPFVWIINVLTDVLLIPFHKRFGEKKRFFSREELLVAVDQSQDAGEFEPSEAQLVQEVIEFTEIKAKDIMIPVEEAAILDFSWNIDRVLEEVRKRRFTRYPVRILRTNKGEKAKILHIKDLLIRKDMDNWQDMLRPLPYRSQDMDADDLMRDMQILRYHMAALRDENENVVGYVTMEHILEEIVGEIADEHDKEDDPIVKTVDPGVYRVRRDLEVSDIEQILNVDLDSENDEQTIGELYRSKCGNQPTSNIQIGAALIHPRKHSYVIEILEGHQISSDEDEELSNGDVERDE